MDEFLNQMRISKNTFRVQLLEFMKICDPNDVGTPYCFVEAEVDKIFYNAKIRSLLDILPITFQCKNKGNVLAIFKEVKGRKAYDVIRKGFFVDRDFDYEVHDADIYVTPYHSVENFYVQQQTVEVIIEDLFRITRFEEDLLTAISYFNRLFALFHERVLLLNIFLRCQALTFDKDIPLKLNVDDKLKKIFANIVTPNLLDIYAFTEIDTKGKIEIIFGVDPIDNKVWDESRDFLVKETYSQAFRGKFEILFLFSFFKRLKESLDQGNLNIWKKKHKSSLAISVDQILHVLPDKVIIPASLRKYIQKLAA
jgi:hypothetical protein